MEGLFRVPGPAAYTDELRASFEEGQCHCCHIYIPHLNPIEHKKQLKLTVCCCHCYCCRAGPSGVRTEQGGRGSRGQHTQGLLQRAERPSLPHQALRRVHPVHEERDGC